MEANLCKCNNCGEILIDFNPLVSAEFHKVLPGEYKNLTWEMSEGAWVCPNCKVDDYLTDKLGEEFSKLKSKQNGKGILQTHEIRRRYFLYGSSYLR